MSQKRKSQEYSPSAELKRKRNEDISRPSTSKQENGVLDVVPRPSTSKQENGVLDVVAPQRAGIILRVKMQNFMCHSFLEVEFNRRINFIVGRNGSGKSAIMTAISVALGSKAIATSRASSLKDLVKKKCRSALLEVTLCNRGLYKYQEAVYGDEIIVSRRIFSDNTSSTYKIKSSKGEVISTKREDLAKILNEFNIHIDNPITILNQETARTFLSSYDPKSMFKLFMKATKLDDVENLYAQTYCLEKKLTSLWQNRSLSVKEYEREYREAEKKYFTVRKLGDTRTAIDKLENELYWCKVNKEVKTLSEMKEVSEIEDEILKSKEEEIHRSTLDMEKFETKLKKLEEEQSDLTKILQEKKKTKTNAEAKEKDCKLLYANTLQEYQSIKKNIISHEMNIKTLKEEILKLNSTTEQEVAAQKKQIQDELNAKKKELEEILAAQRSSEQYHQELKGAESHYKETRESLDAELRTVKQNIEQNKKYLRTLETQESNLTVYGDWMPALKKQIDQYDAAHKFDRKPLGPIGEYLKVRDEKWVPAIESFLGSMLQSFYCHSARDSMLLRDLMKRTITEGRSPGIYVSRFIDKVHNIHDTLPVAEGCISLYEMLDIADPNVANCLIDQRTIENILLIPTNELAYELMSNVAKVPRNCKRGYTMSGYTYYPAPNYKSYAGNIKKKSRFLQVSKKDIIRELRKEMSSDAARSNLLTTSYDEFSAKLNNNTVEVQDTMNKIKILAEKKKKILSDISSLTDSLESKHQNFDALNKELTQLRGEWTTIKRREEEAHEKSRTLKSSIKLVAGEIASVTKEIEEVKQEMQKLLDNMKIVQGKSQSIGNKLRHMKERFKETQIKVDAFKDSVKKQEEYVEKLTAEASELSNEVTTVRSIEDVQEELKDAKNYVFRVEQESGSYEEIERLYIEKKKKYLENNAFLNKLKNGLQTLAAALNDRKTKTFALVLRVTILKVMYMYQPLLRQRHYKGNISVNINEGLINVSATPLREASKRDNKSLSGGERSYATVSFILSLWECIDHPFYFLDEFDVFMDKVNRTVIMELLLLNAMKKSKFQYVFLTPQDTTIQSKSDITIHKLDDPERTKNN